MIIKVGDTVKNTRLNKTGRVINIHYNGGQLTSQGKEQNALTVKVEDRLEVWLQDSDYVTLVQQL